MAEEEGNEGKGVTGRYRRYLDRKPPWSLSPDDQNPSVDITVLNRASLQRVRGPGN